jgi:hypothetical protein
MSATVPRVRQAIRSRLPIAAGLAVLGSCAFVAQAGAYVYWGSNATPSRGGGIGRAKLDGSGVDYQFIRLRPTLTVTTGGSYIYWSSATNAIGRAKVTGTRVQRKFIRTGRQAVTHLAVDGHHIYWTHGPSISRANLDGSGVDKNMINVASSISGLTLDAHHIYWSQPDTHSIGRAKLNGAGVDQGFITTGDSPSHPTGVAVDSRHVYWANYGTETIGRSNINGSGVDNAFITSSGDPIIAGVAVDAGHVYWVSSSAIGRAGIDGGNVDPTFIDGFSGSHGDPAAVAVDRR